jgi:cardiolipin synthase
VHIPNLITLGRVFLVPVVVWLIINGRPLEAFLLFLVAGLSDAVDGYIAKRFGWQSELGAYLDPLADKLLLVSIFIALGIRGALPSWIVIAMVSRDLLIVAGVLLAWVLDRPVVVKPYKISKLNTVAQIALASLVLADEAFHWHLDTLRTVLMLLTAALTFASLSAYLKDWLRHLAGYDTAFGDKSPRV